MSNILIPIEIADCVYTVPAIEHETLEVTTDAETSSAEAGMITEVKVPAGGVRIRFMKGGAPCAPGFYVTTRYWGDREAERVEADYKKAAVEMAALKVEHEKAEVQKEILAKMQADIAQAQADDAAFAKLVADENPKVE